MNKLQLQLLLCFFLLIGCFSTLSAQQLIYKPVNPAFGGDTFNYSWMLSSAQAQDRTVDPKAQVNNGFNRATSLQTFQQSLNNQLLSQLSRQLVTDQFGEDGLEDGTYSIGTLDVQVSTITDGVSIVIFDTNTGEKTEIIIPFF